MNYIKGDVVVVDLEKSNSAGYYAAFHMQYEDGIKFLKGIIESERPTTYTVKSVEGFGTQAVHKDCIDSRCMKCKNDKLWSTKRQKFICPFCNE